MLSNFDIAAQAGGANRALDETFQVTGSAINIQFIPGTANNPKVDAIQIVPATPSANLILNSSVSALNFGSLNLSTASSQVVTLTNAGSSAVTVSNVSITGPGFTAAGVPAGLIMSPGQTATLSVTFSPSSTGGVAGSVTVASNASNSPDEIALSGTGLATANHSVQLSWNPSTSTVIGYNCYSSSVSGGPYAKLTLIPVPATAFMDETVQSGHTYYYVVTAVDSNSNESENSAEAVAIVP